MYYGDNVDADPDTLYTCRDVLEYNPTPHINNEDLYIYSEDVNIYQNVSRYLKKTTANFGDLTYHCDINPYKLNLLSPFLSSEDIRPDVFIELCAIRQRDNPRPSRTTDQYEQRGLPILFVEIHSGTDKHSYKHTLAKLMIGMINQLRLLANCCKASKCMQSL